MTTKDVYFDVAFSAVPLVTNMCSVCLAAFDGVTYITGNLQLRCNWQMRSFGIPLEITASSGFRIYVRVRAFQLAPGLPLSLPAHHREPLGQWLTPAYDIGCLQVRVDIYRW